MVLGDGGCSVDGYQSDITRSVVFGTPSQKQREIWELEKRAQAAAFAAARPGATCESVDAAARKVITDAGFGPDYRLPGLPHRTGHGIGLDGHEWTNFVRGNKTPIAPGHVLLERTDDRHPGAVRHPPRGLTSTSPSKAPVGSRSPPRRWRSRLSNLCGWRLAAGGWRLAAGAR